MPKVLVTGGAGFIGSHVVDRFREAGYGVVVIDNLSTGKRANLTGDVELHQIDIQSADAATVVREGAFDVIAHLAAQVDVRRSVEDPFRDIETNIVGTVNLLEAARSPKAGRPPRFVFASTAGLYGDDATFPADEVCAANPVAPYGIDKLAVEYYLAYYAQAWAFETVVLRFGNVYGPRQDSHGEAGVIAIFGQRLLENRPLTVYGAGDQTRDYVYVADVANAFYCAATASLPRAGAVAVRAYNIGTGVETSVNELVASLSAVAGVRPVVEHAPPRTGELGRSVLDAKKAREHFGWEPGISLRDGLAETYAWLATGWNLPRGALEGSSANSLDN